MKKRQVRSTHLSEWTPMLWSMFSGRRCEAATTGVPSRRARAAARMPRQKGNWTWSTSARRSTGSSTRREGQAKMKPISRITRPKGGMVKRGSPTRPSLLGPPAMTVTSCRSRSAATKRLRGDDAAGLHPVERVDGVGDVQTAGRRHGGGL